MNKEISTRRKFLKQTGIAAGFASVMPYGFSNNSMFRETGNTNKLPGRFG